VSAQALADAAKVSLGTVISITDATQNWPIYYGSGEMRLDAASDLATPVEPGTQDLNANVTVVFEIN
jgi:uncharacterized protein YggE